MPRLNGDTRKAILVVASKLFSTQGFDNTSMREIAEQLGITKAALYYYFSSKDDLLRALTTPVIKDMLTLLEDAAEIAHSNPRTVLEDYFDHSWRHREVIVGLFRDLTVLNQLGLPTTGGEWRSRLADILAGAELSRRVRAVVALGGLQQCVFRFGQEADIEDVRTAAIEAALSALDCGTRG